MGISDTAPGERRVRGLLPERLAILQRRVNIFSTEAIAALGARRELRAEPWFSEAILNLEDVKVRVQVAATWQLTQDEQAALAVCPVDEVREGLASSDHACPSVLRTLSRDPEITVRRAAAMNPATEEDVLWALAADPEEDVRRGLARNPSISPRVRDRLLADMRFLVRVAVLDNPKAPMDMILGILEVPDHPLAGRLIGNPGIPADELQRLAQHPDHRIESVAREELRRRSDRRGETPTGRGFPIAGDWSKPQVYPVADRLIPWLEGRWNPSGREIQEILSPANPRTWSLTRESVRFGIMLLAGAALPDVREVLLSGLAPEIIRDLPLSHEPDDPSSVCAVIASPGEFPGEARLLAGAAAGRPLIHDAIRSPDSLVRIGAAVNPDLGTGLEVLLADPDEEVRLVAVSRALDGLRGP